MSLSPSSNSGVLTIFLFHLRTSLSSIKGASSLAKQTRADIPERMLHWFEKWEPEILEWISDEEKARIYFEDGKEHNWEQIVIQMADKMKDVETAYNEVKSMKLSESEEGIMAVKLALIGVEYLYKMIQPIKVRDFQHLLY